MNRRTAIGSFVLTLFSLPLLMRRILDKPIEPAPTPLGGQNRMDTNEMRGQPQIMTTWVTGNKVTDFVIVGNPNSDVLTFNTGP